MSERDRAWKERQEREARADCQLRAEREENERLRADLKDCNERFARAVTKDVMSATMREAELERLEQADRHLLERCRQIVRWADSVSPGESSTGGLLSDLDARLGESK